MRFADLIGSAVGGLWRQKARTALTLTGVAVGACALTFSLSLGIGLRAMIEREFRSRPEFWVIHVRTGDAGPPIPEDQIPPAEIAVEGDMSEARRERLRRHLVEKYRAKNPRLPPVQLTDENIAKLAALPDVEGVETWHYQFGSFRVGDGKARDAAVVGGASLDRATIRDRVVAGRLPNPDECLVSETALYELGVRDDAGVEAVLGRPLTLTIGGAANRESLGLAMVLGVKPAELTAAQEGLLAKVAGKLPDAVDRLDLSAAEKLAVKQMLAGSARAKGKPDETGTGENTATATFRIAGVVRGLTPEEFRDETRTDPWEVRSAEVLLPPSANRFFDRLNMVKRWKFQSATVMVRPGGDMHAAVAGVERLGFEQYSLLKWHDNAKREVTLIAAGLNLFAILALLIAALGITNTLVTSVVERTREIGILKALGATDRQVLLLFLLEGTVIGVVGGLLGLAVAWGLSIPGDDLVRRLVEQQAQNPLVSTTVFEFPPWLAASSVLFALVVTTLAALYPARRAARVQPVEALRHE